MGNASRSDDGACKALAFGHARCNSLVTHGLNMPYKDTEQQREYQRLWILQRRNEHIQKNGPCTKCLSCIGLEIHHKNPKEKITHRIWSWSKVRREKELAKCEILCHDCHKKETQKFLRKNFEHGTQSMYDSRKCRCSECRAANAATRRKQRRNRKLLGLIAQLDRATAS